jgi:hypothetical protein
MRRPHATSRTGLVPLLLISAAACAPDLDLSDPVSPTAAVVARFDPTNPIPVLTLVPIPTALVQEQVEVAPGVIVPGSLDPDAIASEPCEGEDTSICLPVTGLTGGWAATDLPTLIFSSDIDPDTVADGVVLLEFDLAELPSPTFTRIPVTASSAFVEEPPVACQTEFGYTQAESAAFGTNVVVTLTPDNDTGTLTEGRAYVLGATRDLMAADGRPVAASSLFFGLLQNDVQGPGFEDFQTFTRNEDGTFSGVGLIAASTVDAVTAGVDAAIEAGELPPEARDAAIESETQAAFEGLFGVQTLFQQASGFLLASGEVESIDDLVFANFWTTGTTDVASVPQIAVSGSLFAGLPSPDFDPLGGVLPFPHVPLLTVPVEGGDVRTNIPTDGVTDPIQLGILQGLNQLNGFSVIADITIPFSEAIDPASVSAQNVLVLPYDEATNMPIGGPHPVDVQVFGSTMVIQPQIPLLEDTFYAVGVLGAGAGPLAVTSTSGQPFAPNTTLQLLALPDPLVADTSSTAEILDTANGLAVQCSQVPSGGPLLEESFVRETFQGIEFQLARSRWQPAFEAFENLPGENAIPRLGFATAFPIKTQSLTADIDRARELLADDVNGYASLTMDDRVTEELLLQGPVAQGFICQQLCNAGLFLAPVGTSTVIVGPDTEATTPGCDDAVAVASHPLCGLYTADIDEVRQVNYEGYDVSTGGSLTITPDGIENPRVVRNSALVISGGAAPTGGYPAVIFAHGLGQSKESVLTVANTFVQEGTNRDGWAVILLDLPLHGARTSDLEDNVTGEGNPFLNPDDVTCLPDGTCTGGVDGLQDDDGTGFVSFNLFQTRDNFRQAHLDLLTLVDHIQDGGFDGLVSLDGDRIAFSAHSVGSLVGGGFLAYGSDLAGAHMHAPGGSLVDVILGTEPSVNGDLIDVLVASGICVLDDDGFCLPTPELAQFVVLAETALDPGDPLSLSGAVRASDPQALSADDLLLQIANPDSFVPTPTGLQIADFYGLPAERAPVTDFSTAPGAMFPLGCHQFMLVPVNVVPILSSLQMTGSVSAAFVQTQLICSPAAVPSIDDAVCTTFRTQQQADQWLTAGTVLDVAGVSELTVGGQTVVTCP